MGWAMRGTTSPIICGMRLSIIPGIIPITDLNKIRRFADMNKTTIPRHISDKMEPVLDKPDEMRKIGIDFAVDQCRDLMGHGYGMLHFFALNRADAVSEIISALGYLKDDVSSQG